MIWSCCTRDQKPSCGSDGWSGGDPLNFPVRSSVVSSGREGNSESCMVDVSGMPTDMVRSKGMQLSASARCGEITFDMMPRAWWSIWADVGVVGKRSENAVTIWSSSARSLVATFCSSPGTCCDRCMSSISRSLRSRQADNKLWATSSAVSYIVMSVPSASERCSTWFGVLVLVSFCKSLVQINQSFKSNQMT